MPRDARSANARRSVTALLRQFVAATENEFPTPPDEVLRLAEERANALTDEERQRVRLGSPWIG